MNSTAIYKMMGGEKYRLILGGLTKRVYCHASLEGTLKALFQGCDKNFHYRYIADRLRTIQNGAYVYNASQNSARPVQHRLHIAGSECVFFNCNGESFITNLTLRSSGYQNAVRRRNIPGLYSAEHDSATGTWEAVKPKRTIDTTHAALNGDAADIDEVMRYMPTMLLDAHKDRSKLDSEGFSLFYAPTKKGTDGGWRDMAQYTVAKT